MAQFAALVAPAALLAALAATTDREGARRPTDERTATWIASRRAASEAIGRGALVHVAVGGKIWNFVWGLIAKLVYIAIIY